MSICDLKLALAELGYGLKRHATSPADGKTYPYKVYPLRGGGPARYFLSRQRVERFMHDTREEVR